jgi:hypothetical protein
MTAKWRAGCAVAFVIAAIGLLLAWGPVNRRISNTVFENTTREVVAALPEAERPAARRTCEALWSAIRETGIPNQHLDAFKDFQKYTFTVLEDHEVSEGEAREFVTRAEALEARLSGR